MKVVQPLPLVVALGCAAWLPVQSSLLFAGDVGFEDVTESAGLKEPLVSLMGHGGAIGDVDGDGRPDIYVGGFADRPNEEFAPLAGPPANRLLRNLGDGRFEVWDQPAVEIFARTSGAVFADLDNDGDLELYVANNAKGKTKREMEPQRSAQLAGSRLYRNDSGPLVDISEASGPCPPSLLTGRNVCVFDYDGDGLLDLLVVEDTFTKASRTTLFRNLGDLRFADVNAEVGLPDGVFGLGLAVADLNEDGRPDFFVGHSNRMFLSTDGGRYRESEALTRTFAWEPLDGEDWPCGAAFTDLNRDGRLDLVLSIHGAKARNKLFLNDGLSDDGVPAFRDVTQAAGLPEAEGEKAPHVEIQDFDNDGWPDLYFSTARMNAEGEVVPLIYRGTGVEDGVPQFERSPSWEDAGELVYYPAGPSGDLDGDGRIDLFLINWFEGNHCRWLRNASADTGAWLRIRVAGRTFNREGIGSQIKVYADGKLIGFQELTTGYGYASGQVAACHFGLGEASLIDVENRFPNGEMRRLDSVSELNRELIIEE